MPVAVDSAINGLGNLMVIHAREWRTICIFAILACGNGGVGALHAEPLTQVAVPSEESTKITLTGLEELALQSNPTLRQAVAAVDQVRGNMVQAGLYPNPQVGYLRTDADRGGQARSSGVFFGQEIVTGKKRQRAQAVESREVNRMTRQYQAQVKRVLNDVRIRYYDDLGSEKSAEVAQRLVVISEDGLATTEKLYDVRQASKADVLQARIQLKAVRLTLREACQEVERTKLALRDTLRDAFQRYETARAQIETLRDEILPDAKESLDLTIAGYRSGEISILQVLAARQTFLKTAWLISRHGLRFAKSSRR